MLRISSLRFGLMLTFRLFKPVLIRKNRWPTKRKVEEPQPFPLKTAVCRCCLAMQSLQSLIPESNPASERIHGSDKPRESTLDLASFGRDLRICQSSIYDLFPTPDREMIRTRLAVLAVIPRFIGRDFRMPVVLNFPGAGFSWNFVRNCVAVDPLELLQGNMSLLRYTLGHEGAHRRISRVSFISPELWKLPGFALLSNGIEDPRVNSFAAENYPFFRLNMDLCESRLQTLVELLQKQAGKKLGMMPLSFVAIREYNFAWYNEWRGRVWMPPADLPQPVWDCLAKTLPAARRAWNTYPSGLEADASQLLITEYSRQSHLIIRDGVWPEFSKLVERDIETLGEDSFPKEAGTPGVEEGQPQAGRDNGSGNNGSAAQGGENKKQDAEETETEGENIDGKGAVKKTDESEQARAKYIEAAEAINGFLEGKLSPGEAWSEPNGQHGANNGDSDITDLDSGSGDQDKPAEPTDGKRPAEADPESDDAGGGNGARYTEQRRKYCAFMSDLGAYYDILSGASALVGESERNLRHIFRARKASHHEPGYRQGNSLSLPYRIREVARAVPACDSRAWEHRSRLQDPGVAILLLQDLSGSMAHGWRIQAAMQGTVILAENCHRLSLPFAIYGFNDSFLGPLRNELPAYKLFRQKFSDVVRAQLGGMLRACDGDTLMKQAIMIASAHLRTVRAKERYLLVVTDGEPSASIEPALEETARYHVTVGLGIGPYSGGVKRRFKNGIGEIKPEDFPREFAALMQRIASNYSSFLGGGAK
jgi:hypothetical protein